ncbi:MAG: DNA-binding LacI/PurR family transcriptional regulator [Rubritalea sp.]|jgi:DNA-binding LacI/PurR family transcriptional regulator
MGNLRILSSAEQVAEYLRGELANKEWSGMMPGGDTLARELGVGANTVESALRQLEEEGWLVSQGRRRGRRINLKDTTLEKHQLRIVILLGEDADRYQYYVHELVNVLQDAGYAVSLSAKTQLELGDNVERIACYVDSVSADAWVVCSSTRALLEWFVDSGRLSFAIAGRANRVKIPSIGPDKITPLRVAVQRLVKLGHRRIVTLCRPIRRIPEPGMFERAFLEELELHGIQTGVYNLPNWEEDIDGFQSGLESLFATTPPTAVIIDEAPFVVAMLQFCMKKGLQIPRDFSLICTDSDPSFDWCKPSIAHINWDTGPLSKRILKWANNVAHGKEDYLKNFSPAEFVEGGTIGPVLPEK